MRQPIAATYRVAELQAAIDAHCQDRGAVMKTLLYGVLAYLVLLCFGVLAHAKPHPWPDKALQRCYVFLPDMRSERTKKWCLKQSERMP